MTTSAREESAEGGGPITTDEVSIEVSGDVATLRASPAGWLVLAAAVDAVVERSFVPGAARAAGEVAQSVRCDGGAVEVVSGADPVRVRAGEDGGTVRFLGGTYLLHFAAWFRALADRPGRSVRLDWHAGHPYIAESSLVLALASRDAPVSEGAECVR